MDLVVGTSSDCNENDVPDECDSGHQVLRFTPSDGERRDYFGISVAIRGDMLLIGARLDDDGASDSGSAYLYRLASGAWQFQTKLKPDSFQNSDNFGSCVALVEDWALIGAPFTHDVHSFGGSAYAFRELSGQWQEIQHLTADDAASGDRFGYCVAGQGSTLIVGAYYDDDDGTNSGSAYVFQEAAGVWQQVAKLTAFDAAADDHFGLSTAIDGITAVIGAPDDDHGTIDSGAAYVFRQVDGEWQQIAKLTASDAATDDRFGASVAVAADAVIIGAHRDDHVGANSGSAYVFQEINGVWQQTAKLVASDSAAGDRFGESVAMHSGTALIGAPLADVDVQDCGAVYVFQPIDGFWRQVSKLSAHDASPRDYFGISVGMDGNAATVGAPQYDLGSQSAGTAYVFNLSIHSTDCNLNGVPDECDLAASADEDCNENEFPDQCDLHVRVLTDINADDIPDQCQAQGDFDGDGDVDLVDHAAFSACLFGPEAQLDPPQWISAADCFVFFDSDADRDIDLQDFANRMRAFGP